MSLILIIILSIISFSLRLSASSIDLANKVVAKNVGNSNIGGAVNVGLTASSSFLRICAFIVSRVRDLIGISSILVAIITLVVFLIGVVSASSFILLYN